MGNQFATTERKVFFFIEKWLYIDQHLFWENLERTV